MELLKDIRNIHWLHTLVYGSFYYLYLILIIRFSGKRTLAEMNIFDFIVNIAIGSILATLIVDPSIALHEGLVLLTLLVGLQFLITFLSSRWDGFGRAVKAQPALLYYDDAFQTRVMKKERVTENEIEQAVRNAGKGSLSEVAAVLLESNGKFSVLTGTGDLVEGKDKANLMVQ